MNSALHALLRDNDSARSILAQKCVHTSEALACKSATWLDIPDLVRQHEHSPACVIAVEDCPPKLVRLLRRTPPKLLIITGPRAPEDVPCPVLGPSATLVVGDGEQLTVLSDSRTNLGELLACLPREKIRLAVAPAPPWLPTWLDDPVLESITAVGMVDIEALDHSWAHWFRRQIERDQPPVLIPLGPPPPQLDPPDRRSLLAQSCVHTLEILTGPLVPSAALLAHLIEPKRAPENDHDPARWRQTRRALPLPDLPPAPKHPHGPPLLGLLAARARARTHRAQELLALPEPDLTWPDENLRERSLEVLRSAGEILSDHESKVVLRGFGVEITRQAIAASASGAVAFADKIGYPVVLKAISPDLRRKRELGALQLDLQTAASVRRGYATIVRNIEEQAPHVRLDGVAVCEQIADGTELRCGAVALENNVYAYYASPLGDIRAHPEPALALSPLDWPMAILLAGAALERIPTPSRRRGDPQPVTLAEVFLRLDALLRATDGRILRIDLNPLRLLDATDPATTQRPYVTLDVRITQKPHLEGL